MINKRYIINNQNNSQKNNLIVNDRRKYNHTHTLTSINSNNIIYELNNDYENNYKRINNGINNYNRNNFLYFSSDKERNTLNNKSYGNLRGDKNNTQKAIYDIKTKVNTDIFRIKKTMSPIQEIKNSFN